MPIDCHRKLTPLRWSSFLITHTYKDLVLTFELTITTRNLSLNYLPEDRSDRLQLIESLFESGHTDKQIAEILNERKILTPRGGKHYYQLVFVTRRKFRLRKEREKEKNCVVSNLKLHLAMKSD